ncbi:MAG: alpha/beta hydrolase [Agarilytica sp.]
MAKYFNLKTGVFLLVSLLLVIAALLLLAGRLLPTTAANVDCRPADNDYRCLQVGDYQISTYQSTDKSAELENSKTPVLALHGGPGLSGLPLKNPLRVIEQEHPLFLYDQRGSGYSQIKPNLEDYEFSKLVNEIEDFRRQVIKQEKIILIGHSFGAYMALAYALQHPNRVEKMLLISTPIPETRISTVIDILANGIPPSDPVAANHWWSNSLANYFAQYFYTQTPPESFRPTASSYATMIASANSVMKQGFDLDDLKRIDQPVYLLHGEQEIFNSTEESQRKIASYLENSSVIKIEKTGHWSFLEDTKTFRQRLLDFLNR